MIAQQTVQTLPDAELAGQLRKRVAQAREATAEVLVLLAEVDRRKLYADEGCPTLFAYATERLFFSEGAAYKRIQVARASRRFPVILEFVARGDIHLSGLCLLVPYLDADNHRELLGCAVRQSKRQIEKLVAERFLRQPAVKTTLRRIPERRAGSVPSAARGLFTAATSSTSCGGPTVTSASSAPTAPVPQLPHSNAPASTPRASALQPAPPKPQDQPLPSARRPEFKPLGEKRYLLKMTVPERLQAKLEQAQDLRHAGRTDTALCDILEQAVDLWIADRLKKRYGVGAKPRTMSKRAQQPKDKRQDPSRAIPVSVRRAVYQRDRGQCTYVDAQGRRCAATARLELHHRTPYARGGTHTVENLALLCAAHNQHQARQDYGVAKMAAAVAAKALANRAGEDCIPYAGVELISQCRWNPPGSLGLATPE